jgi:hypothetical protein
MNEIDEDEMILVELELELGKEWSGLCSWVDEINEDEIILVEL